MWPLKYQFLSLKFWLWPSSDNPTINKSSIRWLCRLIERYFDLYMVDKKPWLRLEMIDSAIDRWDQLIVDDLGKVCQADFEHVGRLYEVSKKIGFWIRKKYYKFCVQNWMYVGNTKEIQALSIWNWKKQIKLTIRKCDLSVCVSVSGLWSAVHFFHCWVAELQPLSGPDRGYFLYWGWRGSKPWRLRVWSFFTTLRLQMHVCARVRIYEILLPPLSLSTSYYLVCQLCLMGEPRDASNV